MLTRENYRLLDFGGGRRLERFGPWVLDRPCPAAEQIAKRDPAAWGQAHARFERTDKNQGRWLPDDTLAERWTVPFGPFVLELKPNEYGHLGVFPEHSMHWDWVSRQIAEAPEPPRVLNLFAYTGASTLAAAAAGAEVTHVDAAGNVVAWARRNAELSGLAERPIRWIAEDAVKFARRELKRGNLYDAVILDPPSYGHGARGEVWSFKSRIWSLLELCGELTAGRRRLMLLTAHTPGFGPDRLRRMMQKAFGGDDSGSFDAGRMMLPAESGGELPSGVYVRWQRRS